MASDRAGVYPNQEPHQGRNVQQVPQITLSQEELSVIRECFREAFWYRSAPLFLASVAGIQFLTRRGTLRSVNPVVATARYSGILLASAFVGRALYDGKCKEKILQLPNSKLADAVRSGKKGAELMTFLGTHSNESEQVSSGGSSDFDSRQADYHRRDRSEYSNSMNDTSAGYRPSSMDSEMKLPSAESQNDQPKIYNSYEQLRQQNRMEYDKQRKGLSSQPSSTPEQAPRHPSSYDHQSQSSSQSRKSGYRTNQWGDVVEE